MEYEVNCQITANGEAGEGKFKVVVDEEISLQDIAEIESQHDYVAEQMAKDMCAHLIGRYPQGAVDQMVAEIKAKILAKGGISIKVLEFHLVN